MAGRGRGRGRGSMSFNVENLGFRKGDQLPTTVLQPPPNYPPLDRKPLPLNQGQELEYLLALKQEYRMRMQDSPFFIKPSKEKVDIARYSDKYQQISTKEWEPDYTRLPNELKISSVRKRKSSVPNLSGSQRVRKGPVDVTRTMEMLEQQEKDEKSDQEGEGHEKAESAEEEDDDEEKKANDDEVGEPDEEDLEEETDYNLTYFDNGENFGHDEDDDLEEGPVY